MKETSPESNSIVCKQLQPSQSSPPPNLSRVAEATTFVDAASKFGEWTDEELLLLQMLTTLQTSCLLHETPVVVGSDAVVVGFVAAVVVVARIVVVFQPFVVVA